MTFQQQTKPTTEEAVTMDNEEIFYVDDEPEQREVDPRLDGWLNHHEQQMAEAAYDAELARINEQHPGIIEDTFHPLVVAADGDFNVAYQMYENVIHQFNAHAAAGAAPEFDQAPEPTPTTISDAVDNLVNDLRANRR